LVSIGVWRRDAGVEHLQLVAQHLDLAAGEVGVLGAARARTHLAHHLQAELVAHAFGGLEHLGAVGVADDLHQAFAVAQVDEDHAAVVAAAVGPAHQGHGLAHQLSLTRPQ
jgi:GNAT superfamily N-acetyltransferase